MRDSLTLTPRVAPSYLWRTIRRFAWPDPAASVRVPADYGLCPQAFSVRAEDGVMVRGWLLKPKQPRGVVILCHGRGANMSRLLPHMALLDRARFATVAFDFRGCGASDNPPTRWFNSMWEPLRDLEAVARFVDDRFGRDPRLAGRIALMGLSFGGNMAIAHAGTTNRTYAALVLDSTPLLRWGGMLAKLLEAERLGEPPSRLRAACDALAVASVVRFTRADALYRHARTSAKNLAQTSLLLILGGRDSFFDIEQSCRFVDRYYAGDARVWRVPTGRHLTNHIACADEYERQVVSFLCSAMNRNPS